jgi:hypothetical protein
LGILVILFALAGKVEQLLDIFRGLRLLGLVFRFRLGLLGLIGRRLIGLLRGLIFLVRLRLILGLLGGLGFGLARQKLIDFLKQFSGMPGPGERSLGIPGPQRLNRVALNIDGLEGKVDNFLAVFGGEQGGGIGVGGRWG